MTSVAPFPPEALCRGCDADELPFATTDELPDLIEFIGQERARQAVDLGVRMRHQGYNIFAYGAPGTGKLSLVSRSVARQAAAEPPPDDWCYVNNFEMPARPRALRLPAGVGKQLRTDMQRFTQELRTGLSSAFESEEVQARRQRLAEEFQERQAASLNELNDQARAEGLALIRTPSGLAFAPLKEGNVLPPEEFEKLPEEEQEAIKQRVDSLQDELQKVVFKIPGWERELRRRMRDLHQEITLFVLQSVMGDLTERYAEHAEVAAWLQTVRDDVVEHVLELISAGERQASGDGPSPMQGFLDAKATPRRYEVNLLVDASEAKGAPVLYESNPTFLNLIGRVEHIAQMGALTTDFMLIKPGALHRANGGYLLLDAQRLLTASNAWEALKRALHFRQIRIESPLEQLGLTSTISLEPEPIPLTVKVILMGEPVLYYLLSAYDPDFNELFKVSADFDDELERTPENELLVARLVATIARRDGLRAFDRSAVARLIEQSARETDDASRLNARISDLKGLMQEADHWAGEASGAVVMGEHVQQALASRIFRLNRMEQRMREAVLRGELLIDSEGEKVGQINALSVVQMGKYQFGHPSRITASVRLGSGEVIDIEREVEMGGPIHSKGVLILSNYLRARYSPEEPLSLAASLVFEQNYGGVEGDSASSTELYVLLSAIANVPLKQSIGVTGSVNQLGQVQAIGGVNEKVEGFFDLCKARGLTGAQGALIPAVNAQHLMLRADVVEAVRAGQFHIWGVETVDQGIEILTGLSAGERQADGSYPEGSINRKVMERLAQLTEARKKADDLGGEEEKQTAKPGRRRRKPADKPNPEPDPTPGPLPSPNPDPEPGPDPLGGDEEGA